MKIAVASNIQNYEVTIELGLRHRIWAALEPYDGQQLVIVTDENVYDHHRDWFEATFANRPCHISILPAGERSKSMASLEHLLGEWHGLGLDRSGLALAVGGGVVGDLTGFAAATYMRGIGYIQMPTTLLAQVDSSMGGKTAVNLSCGKNLAGVFYPPKAVWIDPEFLDTLPPREWRCGMAEMIKSALIGDKALYQMLLSAQWPLEAENLHKCIVRAAKQKIQWVAADEMESGVRQMLNFGHSLGHALEAKANFQGMSHGEAVAQGMIFSARRGEALGITRRGTSQSLVDLLEKVGLPTALSERAIDLKPWVLGDKKKRGDVIQWVMIKSPGEACLWPVTLDQLDAFLIEEEVK